MKTLFVIVGLGCAQSKSIAGPCEGCELMFENMPQNISERTNISKPGEAGDPLIISGIIYHQDGKTPAPGVILYVYHTDNEGLYSPGPNKKQLRVMVI
jgi:protocatechuate 3,4-dioxygenase, beta subunit